MSDLAVIGISENVKIFKGLGAEVHQVKSTDEARDQLKKIFESGTRLIFVLGTLGKELSLEISEINRVFGYNVMALPDETFGLGQGALNLAEKVKKAIGFKIREMEPA